MVQDEVLPTPFSKAARDGEINSGFHSDIQVLKCE